MCLPASCMFLEESFCILLQREKAFMWLANTMFWFFFFPFLWNITVQTVKWNMSVHLFMFCHIHFEMAAFGCWKSSLLVKRVMMSPWPAVVECSIFTWCIHAYLLCISLLWGNYSHILPIRKMCYLSFYCYIVKVLYIV